MTTKKQNTSSFISPPLGAGEVHSPSGAGGAFWQALYLC